MFFALPNLSSSVARRVEAPWEVPSAPAEKLSLPKDRFRDWGADSSTQHTYLSLVEGLDPERRVADKEENPPVFIHGVFGDYDFEVEPEKRSIEFLLKKKKGDFLPNYVCRSHSGGVHAVWLFESPVRCSSSTMAAAFLEHAHIRLKSKSFYPNMGKESWDPFQYFELGTEWLCTCETKVPENHVWHWLFEAGAKVAFTLDLHETAIPMAEVAKRVEELFPGVWDGDGFEPGVRGKAFWLKDSTALRCAVVREGGMQCFLASQPAFLPWSKLLGRDWCEKFHADRVGAVIKNLYFSSEPPKYFHIRNLGPDNAVVEDYNKEDTSVLLQAEYGITNKKSESGLRETDEVLHRIRVEKKVDEVGPLIYRQLGVQRLGQTNFLNTSRVRVLPPAPEHSEMDKWGVGFPLIASILQNLFRQPSYMKELNKHPLEFFLAWARIAYTHGLALQPVPGQVMFICGPTNIGKSVLINHILAPLFSGYGATGIDCSNFAFGRTEFNSELASAPTWVIDDKRPDNKKEHDHYTNFIKTTAAVQNMRVRKLYSNAAMVNWLGRLVVLMNLDNNSAYLLPNMERSLKDKVHLFYCRGNKTFKFPPKHLGDQQFRQELPYFARWLLSWRIPPHCIVNKHGTNPRFGILHYHDLEVLNASFRQGSTYGFFDALTLYLRQWLVERKGETEWVGTPAQLSHEMSSGLFRGQGTARDFTPTMIGMQLSKLSVRGTGIHLERGARRQWHIPVSVVDLILRDEAEEDDVDGDLMPDADAIVQDMEEHGTLPVSMVDSVEQIKENADKAMQEAEKEEVKK